MKIRYLKFSISLNFYEKLRFKLKSEWSTSDRFSGQLFRSFYKGSEIMEKRNRIIADFYRRHKTLDIKRNNAGGNRATKKAFIWKMPDIKYEDVSDYLRIKVKNIFWALIY